MCICSFTLTHPNYALILCTNRDEFLSRPTTRAHFHSFKQDQDDGSSGEVLSGRDSIAGGTWLGVNLEGKLGLLTNITEPLSYLGSSRGHLLSSFLLSEDMPYETKSEPAPLYSGFNMLLLSPLFTRDSSKEYQISYTGTFVTNGGAGGAVISRPLTKDEYVVGAFSNSADSTSDDPWPKVCKLRDSVRRVVERVDKYIDEDMLVAELMECLSWRSDELPRQRSELRNTVQVPPLTINLKAHATAEKTPGLNENWYGTRLSTVILVRRDGNVLFVERDVWKLVDGHVVKGDPLDDRVFRFALRPEAVTIG